MRIERIEFEIVEIPRRKMFVIATGSSDRYTGVIVKLHTDGGIVGVGEASPSRGVTGETPETVCALLPEIEKKIKGLHIEEYEKIRERLNSIKGNSAAKAGVEIAINDALGKEAGLPVAKLLGLYRERIPTSITIGIESREETLKDAERLLGEGAKVLKVKIGLNWMEDIERLKALRERFGYGFRIRVDANQGYSVKTAIKVVREIEPLDIEFIEQPVKWYDVAGLAEVTRASPIPVMADEAVHDADDLLKLAKARACDMVNIKLMKCGGIREAYLIAHLAERLGMECMIGCMSETRVGISAGTHAALGIKNIHYADLDGHIDLEGDVVKEGGVKTENGENSVPMHLPGIGCGL
ncbi:MAG: dipeptide epimerase [Thermoplasmata archaeon]|nr:dipeptide epimerase [Thermoplasmata archaeon]